MAETVETDTSVNWTKLREEIIRVWLANPHIKDNRLPDAPTAPMYSERDKGAGIAYNR